MLIRHSRKHTDVLLGHMKRIWSMYQQIHFGSYMASDSFGIYESLV